MSPGKYVVFSLGPEQFGLPVENIEQILISGPVTRIPKTSKEVLGVFNLRGETLPVIDTQVMLSTPTTHPGCFIVVAVEGVRAAFVADKVERILDLEASQIEPTSRFAAGKMCTHTGRIGDRLVVHVEPSALMPKSAVANLAPAGNTLASAA